MRAHDVGSNEKLFYKEFLAKIAFVWRGWVGAMPRLQQAGRDGEVVGGAVELALARLLALVQPPGHSAPEHHIATLDTSRVNSRSLESRLAKTANLFGPNGFYWGRSLHILFCRPPSEVEHALRYSINVFIYEYSHRACQPGAAREECG